MKLQLPLWVYWTLAGLGVTGAAVFTVIYDFSILEREQAQRLLFIVWGGPMTLVIASALVTYLKRSSSS